MDAYLQLMLGAAFLAGLAGGLHCAAMCGPLIGITCGTGARGGKVAWLGHALAYNAGRIASYSAAGIAVGAIGAGGVALKGTPQTQQVLLLAMSASLILIAVHIAGFAPFVRAVERAGAAGWRHIEPWTRRFLPVNSPRRAFGAGLILGWLPCGMVYVALIAALATANPLHGGLVMAAFGLGTLPNVLTISATLRGIAAAGKRTRLRALAAAVIAAVGIAGILKATHPAAASLLGQCLDVPAVSAFFGGH